MTDAEVLIMIADVVRYFKGPCSRNEIIRVANLVGFPIRRQVALAVLSSHLQSKNGNRLGTDREPIGNRKPPTREPIGNRSGTDREPNSRSKGEKKSPRGLGISLNKSYEKLDTSYLAKSGNFGDFEADVLRWLDYQAEKRGAAFTLRAAQIALGAIAKARAKHGDEWTAETLERTIDKGADLGYFQVVARNTPIGSRASQNGTTSAPSLFGSRGAAKVATDDLTREVAERFREVSR